MIKFTKPTGDSATYNYSPEGLKLSRIRYYHAWGVTVPDYYVYSGRELIEEWQWREEELFLARYNPGISVIWLPGTERENLIYVLFDPLGSTASGIGQDGSWLIIDFDEFGIKRKGCPGISVDYLGNHWNPFTGLNSCHYDSSTGTYINRPSIDYQHNRRAAAIAKRILSLEGRYSLHQPIISIIRRTLDSIIHFDFLYDPQLLATLLSEWTPYQLTQLEQEVVNREFTENLYKNI